VSVPVRRLRIVLFVVSRALVLLTMAALLSVGCASGVETTADEPSGGSATSVAPTESTSRDFDDGSGGTAPPSSVTTLDDAEVDDSGETAPVEPVALVGGGQLDIGSIEGTDTVLWFWAPW
jgi:hypothetical protein